MNVQREKEGVEEEYKLWTFIEINAQRELKIDENICENYEIKVWLISCSPFIRKMENASAVSSSIILNSYYSSGNWVAATICESGRQCWPRMLLSKTTLSFNKIDFVSKTLKRISISLNKNIMAIIQRYCFCSEQNVIISFHNLPSPQKCYSNMPVSKNNVIMYFCNSD